MPDVTLLRLLTFDLVIIIINISISSISSI